MKKLLLLLSILGCTFGLWGQTTLKIKVLENKTQAPLPFANIYLLKNEVGSVSDLSGQATIPLPATYIKNDSLTVSFIGYKDTTIAIQLPVSHMLTVGLSSEAVQLNEVVVNAQLRDISGREIIRKAIKKIKQNYPRQNSYLNSFYREMVYEEDTCVQVNEAVTKIHYTRYPQRRYVRPSFRQFYAEDYYFRYTAGGGIFFSYPQYFKYYNTKKDQAQILAARVSDYNGHTTVIPAPNTGPLALTAMDKVKYLADFFDSKLLKKYAYHKTGAVYIGETLCYAINFYPQQENRRVFQAWNKKMGFAIYAGTIYVDVESFAVVKFNCRFTPDAKLDVYKNDHDCRRFPAISDVSVSYKKEGNSYHLNKVVTTQKTIPKPNHICVPTSYNYTCVRELIVNSTTTQNVQKLATDDPSLLKDVQFSNLRDYPVSYPQQFWENYTSSSLYPTLSKSTIAQLEKHRPLQDQFAHRFLQADIAPPIAPIIADTITYNDSITYLDNYAWLRNPWDSLTQAYIREENNYFLNFFIPFKRNYLQAYSNMTNASQACNPTTPIRLTTPNYSPEGIFGITENDSLGHFKRLLIELAQINVSKVSLKDFALAKDKETIAIISHTNNGQQLHLYDISNQYVIDSIQGTFDDYFWLNDKQFCYTLLDPTNRVYQLYCYDISKRQNKLLLTSIDREHELELQFTSYQSLIVNDRNSESNAFYLLSATGQNTLIPLTTYGEYHGDFIKEDDTYLYLLAHKGSAQNSIYRLAKSNLPTNVDWKKHIEAQPQDAFDDIHIKEDLILVKSIENGAIKLYRYSKDGKDRQLVALPETHCSIQFENSDKTKDFFFESPNTAGSFYTLTQNKLQETPVFCRPKEDTTIYQSELQFVQAKDGVDIPVRISYHPHLATYKGIYLKVYGAYGAFQEAGFDEYLNYLMNEGYIIATAHVRGSRAKGEAWYQSGKLLQKKNSFTDYITCAEHYKRQGLLGTKKIIAYGQSAGGLVIGVAMNQAPHLFDAAIFDYPYLDVIHTMFDDQLYLTTTEYTEWGNPSLPEELAYISTYSPYQNITKKDYPPMLFLSGSKDKSTPYWQVLKSVAKYRQMNTNNTPIYTYTSRGGHPGSIPYQQRMKEMMYLYFFMEKALSSWTN